MLHKFWQFLRSIESVVGSVTAATIWQAARFAEEKHGTRQRPNGDLQIDHSLRVAIRGGQYAVEYGFSAIETARLVCGCLLHDLIEDEGVSHEELSKIFGQEIAGDVLALSKDSEDEPDAIYFARIETRNQFAILAKRFDILDNTQRLVDCSANFRAKKVAERLASLPLWQAIDPEGAEQIQRELEHLRVEVE